MQTEIELRYMKLKDKVKKLLAAQKDYFRSNHDKHKLMIAKSLEKEVDKMINPVEENTLFKLDQ